MDLPLDLTRFLHYQQLPQAKRENSRAWSQESALVALGLFLREEGRFPTAEHCTAREGMPSQETIRTLFRSYRGWKAAYLEATGAPDPRPWLARARSPYTRRVPCLRCDKLWLSPDVRRYRICAHCRCDKTEHDHGLWLSGRPLIAAGVEMAELWEDAG